MAQQFPASQVTYYFFTGETSGDDRAAELVDALLAQKPLATLYGVPGPRLRERGVRHTISMESFQVMGFLDVIKALPRLIRLFYRVKEEILRLNPEHVVFVDYPGFSLKMAKALRKAGYRGKIVQYVCPTVWAWKKHRTQILEKHFDLLLTLLPFEPPLFDQEKLDVRYVGHPLIEQEQTAKKSVWEPPCASPFLAIFPGSREHEIVKNLPLQLAVAQETRLPCVVSCAQPALLSKIEAITRGEVPVAPPEALDSLMEQCSYAVATSGTVCLQLALHNVPTVCCYAIRPLDEFIATKIFAINLSFYCIVNIIAEREIFPELFGSNLTFHRLQQALNKIIDGTHPCDTRCLREKIGEKLASQEASDALVSLAHTP